MFIKFAIAAAVGMFSFSAVAQPEICEEIRLIAESEAVEAQPPLGHRVNGVDRTHLHSAPFASCKTAVFVVPKDHLTAYKNFDDWWLVNYTHPVTGDVSEGWVKEARLVYTGTMGLTN